MGAGTGFLHSEFNASNSDKLNFLQIWIIPTETGVKPRYAQKHFLDSHGVTLIASSNGENESLPIRQDARVYKVKLEAFETAFQSKSNRVYYLQLASSSLVVNQTSLIAGNGAFILDEYVL